MVNLISGSSYFLLLPAGALFVAVVLIVMAANAIYTERRRIARRVGISALEATADRQGTSRISIEAGDDLFKRFARFLTPKKEGEISETRLRLARAGFRRPSAVRILHFARASSGVAFTLVGALLFPSLFHSFPLPITVGMIFIAFFLGFTFPSILLDRQIARRKQAAEEGFPDTLDMMLVCIEAGQSFDQTSRRIARELKSHNKVLAEEFEIVNDELWAGKERTHVFRDFAARLCVDDITAFVTVLRQADQFGVSIAEAIRVYAADMRFKRVMRAEEKANMMPLKLALASMLFTVPPTMLIMVGPSIMEIIHSFSHA
jgi:tight adherence protein C